MRHWMGGLLKHSVGGLLRCYFGRPDGPSHLVGTGSSSGQRAPLGLRQSTWSAAVQWASMPFSFLLILQSVGGWARADRAPEAGATLRCTLALSSNSRPPRRREVGSQTSGRQLTPYTSAHMPRPAIRPRRPAGAALWAEQPTATTRPGPREHCE